jgi:hypothetical protein
MRMERLGSSLILRGGVFAASRRMGRSHLMVRDGAFAPPHHEAIDDLRKNALRGASI